MIVREFASWIETANASNATATATRAATSVGLRHFITSISASSSVDAMGILLTLKQGSTEIGRWYVHNSMELSFSSPIVLEPGTVANLEFAATGAASTGAVTMTGYTQ